MATALCKMKLQHVCWSVETVARLSSAVDRSRQKREMDTDTAGMGIRWGGMEAFVIQVIPWVGNISIIVPHQFERVGGGGVKKIYFLSCVDSCELPFFFRSSGWGGLVWHGILKPSYCGG